VTTAQLFDVAIVGAGPGGSTAALGLARAGYKVVLIDKSSFPRHKVCGDAIPNNAMRLLQEHYPDLTIRIREDAACPIDGYQAFWKARRIAQGSWSMQAINSARKSFDQVLLEAALEEPNCQLATPHRIQTITRQNDGNWQLTDNQGQSFWARALILAQGANGDFRQQIGLPSMDKSQWGVAGSQYRTHWNPIPNRNLFFIPKSMSLPGYFWIFPVGENRCNVGFGVISKEPVKLKSLYEEVCQKDPKIAQFLEGTQAETEFQGHKIPIPTKPIKNSAPGVLLIGDAAELVDPLYGHGIDKAIISGHWAAEALIQGFSKNDLESFDDYEAQIQTRLWPEMRKSYRRMKWLSRLMRIV
jgi:geranylgeranyl reductase family protein